MKFSISSNDLQKALNAVVGVVPSKATMPILENVLFTGEKDRLTLTATDLELKVSETINTPLDMEGSVAVPGKKLLEFLKALPDIPVTLEADGNNSITIRTDKGAYRLIGEAADQFPQSPDLGEHVSFEVSSVALKKMIQKTSFAVSTDDMRPAMMGVYFQIGTEESKIVATDGHRLVRLNRTDIHASKPTSFIVPEKALGIVSRTPSKEVTEISVFKDHVQFKTGTTLIVTRKINETYPNYETVIPKENDKIMRVDRDELLAAVKRVAIFSSSSTRQVRLEVKRERLLISAEDIDLSSEAKESISCEYSSDPMIIGFNSRYLSDVLGNVDSADVQFDFSTPNRAGIVKPVDQEEHEKMLMLVMPVMLSNYS
jgi:DNA polymerase-3 subunit beta